MNLFLTDVYPSKAQYLSGENIYIILEFHNRENKEIILQAEVRVNYLSELVNTYNSRVMLQPGEYRTITMEIGSHNDCFKGYGVDVSVYICKAMIDTLSTAFDVVSDWRMAARYGFLSDFHPSECGENDDISGLRKLHLNMIQFYDWMYRHDDLIPKDDIFTDLMGRELSYKVVREKITACKEFGMKAIAYGAVYAASRDFYEQHKDWALYGSNGNPLSLGEMFYIMNTSSDNPWHRHIIEQYENAICEAGFDGIHMDTYGFPKTAISKYNGINRIESLEKHFPELIDNTKKALSKAKQNNCLIFNNVGNWPVAETAKSADVVYIEVWKPYERYHHIQQVIREAKAAGGSKPVVLAAYLKPFQLEEEENTHRAEAAMRLLTAIITSNGGYHLILGENKGILTQGYYAAYAKLKEDFLYTVRSYYDFIVRYSNIFFDNELGDVSMTHLCGDNEEYVVENNDYSCYGEPDKVWVLIKEKPELKYISFVNLKGNSEDYWNAGKAEPTIKKGLRVNMEIQKDVKTLYVASPDSNTGRPLTPEYEIYDGKRSRILSVTMPDIYYWSILAVEFYD